MRNHTNYFSFYTFAAALGMATYNEKEFTAGTISRLAIDATEGTDIIKFSLQGGPVADGLMEYIGSVKLPDDLIFVQVETPRGGMTKEFMNKVASISTVIHDQAEQFGTAAYGDLGKDITSWSGVLIKPLGNEEFEVQDIGSIAIQPSCGDTYLLVFNGMAVQVKFDQVINLVLDAKKLGDELKQNGIEIPEGYFLIRTPDELGMALTNGDNTIFFDQDLKKVDDEVKGVILPKIDADGETIPGMLTCVTGFGDDWTIEDFPAEEYISDQFPKVREGFGRRAR